MAQKLILILMVLFCGFLVSANSTVKIDLLKYKAKNIPHLYETLSKSKVKGLNSLSRLKYFEIHGDWDQCLRQAHISLKSHPLVGKAIASVWLHCFIKSEKKTEKNFSTLSLVEKMNKDDRQKIYTYLSETSKVSNPSMSIYFDKLANQVQNGKETFIKRYNYSSDGALEIDLEKKFLKEQEESKYIESVKTLIQLFNLYPGSAIVAKYKDKPIEIYNSTSSTSVLLEMGEAHYTRLQRWALQLHNKLNYREALLLAERALQKSTSSPSTTQLLWIAGRSSLFIGDYDKALVHFQKLKDEHQGTEEAYEAGFRWGLLQFRLKNYAMAKQAFINTIGDKRDRYLLSSLYWLYRSLQNFTEGSAISEAQAIRDQILADYPFSYFGLKLNAEKNQGNIQWPEKDQKQKKLESNIWLDAYNFKKWERFEILAKNGWVNEAAKEFEEIDLYLNSTQKWSLSKILAQYRLYTLAFKIANEVMDEDPSLRQKDFLEFLFPNVYPELYEKESKKYKLDITFLRSLTRQESAFNPQAVSSSNALGLMQMIPLTAQEVARNLKMDTLKIPEDMFLPENNIPMGSYYISSLVRQFNEDIPKALAAYNAGPTRLNMWVKQRELSEFDFDGDLWMDELPWYETSFYVKAILRNILLYKMIESDKYVYTPTFWKSLILK